MQFVVLQIVTFEVVSDYQLLVTVEWPGMVYAQSFSC